jgi:hypothetical protein
MKLITKVLHLCFPFFVPEGISEAVPSINVLLINFVAQSLETIS